MTPTSPPCSSLGVLCVGLGSVSTTLIAGVMATNKGVGRPVGSLTQMEHWPGTGQYLHESLGLYDLSQLHFGAWDVHPDNAYKAAQHAGVLDKALVDSLKTDLEAISPMSAVFDPERVPNLKASHVKTEATRYEQAQALREDIRRFKSTHDCDQLVVVWCASTELYRDMAECHLDIARFEAALQANDPAISPTMIYAWAALKEGHPFVNGSPNSALDTPALRQMAEDVAVPVAGSDLKTGQTLVKTAVAPMFRQRLLGVNGWFSTNILGNRDGEVLNHSGALANKARTKTGVLNGILSPESHPELYSSLDHQVYINYYLPRGDQKEGWDNIDLYGWLDYPMQMKINFLCRDSILAAPVVLDLILLIAKAQQQGFRGVQDWLAFFFKAPDVSNGRPVHALSEQHAQLFETLESMR